MYNNSVRHSSLARPSSERLRPGTARAGLGQEDKLAGTGQRGGGRAGVGRRRPPTPKIPISACKETMNTAPSLHGLSASAPPQAHDATVGHASDRIGGARGLSALARRSTRGARSASVRHASTGTVVD
eukprot:scaffold1497_cov128-Isochrysis_galbana.AAC.3